MKLSIICLVLLLSAFAPAFADPPTITLTQDQLSRLIQSENAKAVASYITSEKSALAKDVYESINKAFSPQPKHQ